MKTIKAYVYPKKPGDQIVHTDGVRYIIDKHGAQRKVVVDGDGKILGVPIKYSKKDRKKIRAREKAIQSKAQ